MSKNENEKVTEAVEEKVDAPIQDSEDKAAVTKKKSSKENKPQKKKLSKALCVGIIAIFAVISFMVGIIVADVPITDIFSKTKTFTTEEINIVLPKDFTPTTDRDGFIACYGTNDVSLYIKKDIITQENDLHLYDLDNYRLNLLHKNGLVYDDLKNTEGNAYFVYDYVNEASNVTYTFYTFTYKTDDAFWVVQFATEKNKAVQYEADIIQWAETVTFTK